MSASSGSAEVREGLRSISRALQDLHRALLGYQRREYEKFFGRIGSDFYVLQLAAEDPQFAWLRALSGEIMRIDSIVSAKADIDPAELYLTGNRVRYLLLPTADGNNFQSHYDRAMQVNPEIIMAHAAAMRALPPARRVMLFRSEPPNGDEDHLEPAGSTTMGLHPGHLVPGHEDHGYRALALVQDMRLAPGHLGTTTTSANEDVIVLVTDGAMQFDEVGQSSRTVDARHLLVLNGGSGVEYTLSAATDDSTVRAIRTFLRPTVIGLDPRLQYGELPQPEAGAWRQLVGPEDTDAAFTVRNHVVMSDITLGADSQVILPSRHGWDTFFIVVGGRVEVDGVVFDTGMTGLVKDPRDVTVSASEPSSVIAFEIDPRSRITRAGRTAR